MIYEEKVNKFRNEKIAVNCETEEEAKSFIQWCYENGMTWKYTTEDETFFVAHKNETCYFFNFNGNESIGYSDKQFYEEEEYEIIKYKDFMKEEKKTTNLEYVASKGLINEHIGLCRIAYMCKHSIDCADCVSQRCSNCEFDKNINLCIKTLLKKHKETVKLTQFEFDLLKAKLESYGNCYFSSCKDLRKMQEKGHFKGVIDTSMTIQEILNNCEATK